MNTEALLNTNEPDGAAGDFIKTLEQSGFFRQIGDLEGNLSRIASDLSSIGERATERVEEVETLAAHVVAIEAVISVLLRTHPVDIADVQTEVTRRTEALSDSPGGSPTVQAVAADLVAAGA